jgi:hypothetical protein
VLLEQAWLRRGGSKSQVLLPVEQLPLHPWIAQKKHFEAEAWIVEFVDSSWLSSLLKTHDDGDVRICKPE